MFKTVIEVFDSSAGLLETRDYCAQKYHRGVNWSHNSVLEKLIKRNLNKKPCTVYIMYVSIYTMLTNKITTFVDLGYMYTSCPIINSLRYWIHVDFSYI
jgi:hypothetical protein